MSSKKCFLVSKMLMVACWIKSVNEETMLLSTYFTLLRFYIVSFDSLKGSVFVIE